MFSTRISTLFDIPPDARIGADYYIAMPQSARKSDLIEGVFIMASPASIQHADQLLFWATILRNFVSRWRLGLVLGGNVAFRLNDENVYQPDVAFLSKDRLQNVRRVYVDGAPDLVVEISTPDSSQYDSFEKHINYARAGVQEYWHVDLVSRTVAIYRQIEGQYTPVQAADGMLRSQVLRGFWVDPQWVFPSRGNEPVGELAVARAQGLV